MSRKDVSDDGTGDDARKEDGRQDDGAAKRFIRRHVRNREDQRDVLQNAFVVFMSTTKRIHNPSGLLRGIARKLCFRQWRKDRTEGKIFNREVTPEDVADFVSHEAPGLDDAEDTQRRLDLVDEAVRRLTAEQRLVLKLRFQEGLTVEQTAERCGLSRFQVKRRQEAGLEAIRKFVKRRQGGAK